MPPSCKNATLGCVEYLSLGRGPRLKRLCLWPERCRSAHLRLPPSRTPPSSGRRGGCRKACSDWPRRRRCRVSADRGQLWRKTHLQNDRAACPLARDTRRQLDVFFSKKLRSQQRAKPLRKIRADSGVGARRHQNRQCGRPQRSRQQRR